jgi:hypothetical protein
MRYQNLYVWLVLVSALDIMLTWVILYLGGYEVNGVAAWVLHQFGLKGIVIFKFIMVIVVVLLCETLAKRHSSAGMHLAQAAIGLTCIPVVVALLQLWWH